MTPTILTYTGRCVNPLNVQVTDVCVEDIAHHLAAINRFNGATQKPISVAQHAVYVSRLLRRYGRLGAYLGLHHDDGEAYCGDMTKWLKSSPEMAKYRAAEEQAQQACYDYFRIAAPTKDSESERVLEWADRLMVRYEATYGLPKGVWDAYIIKCGRTELYGPITDDERQLVGPWAPWSAHQAEEVFLAEHRGLYP